MAAPKYDETIILFHPSASSFDSTEPRFVHIAAFLLVLHQCRHKQLDAVFELVLVGPFFFLSFFFFFFFFFFEGGGGGGVY